MRKIKFKATKVFQDILTAIKTGKYKLIIEEGSSRSSKTWSNFQILFLEMFETPMTKITVLRDTQKSCRDIVEGDWIQWLKDPQGRVKQYEDGLITITELDKYLQDESFHKLFVNNKTNHTWTLPNGSFMVFTGLDDVDNAMGMTQDICWINEPYKFSIEIYNQLAQRTSKYILFDWNPKQNHWIEKKKKEDDVFVHYSTFEDNPFCPPKMKYQIWSYQPLSQFSKILDGTITESDALTYDSESNPLNFNKKQLKELTRCIYNESVGTADLYHWLVFGRGLKSEKPNKIYRGWEVISNESFENYKNNFKYVCHFGLDYGFINPSACVEVLWNGENAFYLREVLYESIDSIRKRGSTLGDELLARGVPSGNNHYIFADSQDKDARNNQSVGADLRTNYSLNIVKVEKPSYVERFDFISKCKIFYTAESSNIEFEYENYEREVINGMMMEWPIKKDDHCFIGNTLITTINGQEPIENISIGDLVLTTKGYKKVLHKWDNGDKKVFDYVLNFGNKSLSLTCTSNHKIKTNLGWIEISKLKKGMTVFLNNTLEENRLSYRRTKDTSTMDQIKCIGMSGSSSIKGKDRKATTFITSIITRTITELRIWNWLKAKNTLVSTAKSVLRIIQNGLMISNQKGVLLQRIGTNRQKAENGIDNTQLIAISGIKHLGLENVNVAMLNLKETQNTQSFAQENAHLNSEEIQELIISQRNAHNAELSLNPTDIVETTIVAVSVEERAEERVYDLTVEDQHEYFANGVLVHNCMNSLEYALLMMKKYYKISL